MGTTITICTNNVPRDVIHGYELGPDERAEFDYIKDFDCAEFFRYRGELYDIGEFSRVIAPGSKRCHPMECAEPAFQGWDGYQSDSFFSGMLIRWFRDGKEIDSDRVVIGMYYS